MLCVRDSSKFQGPAIDVVLATTPACQRDATPPGARRTARPNRGRSLVLKWNDCQANAVRVHVRRAQDDQLDPRGSVPLLHRCLVYERCARCVLGMAICGACMASPARLVRVWPRRPPTKGTDGGGRIECDPCPRCNHAAGDRGRTALPGKGMALSERGIEALARPLERRTRRPQRQAEDEAKRTVCCGPNASH